MLIELSSISRSYRLGGEDFFALDNFNWSMEKGEYIAITGASGSGKSTLMNIIGCLDKPTAGSYLFEGEELSCRSREQLAKFRNKTIGFVFQQFNLIPFLSAVENVMLPLRYGGTPRDESYEKAQAVLTKLGLGNRITSKPLMMSGGQQQRVAIARALVTRPRLLLADEPTGALDSKTTNEIMTLFGELSSEGASILIVTHDPNVAARARRVTTLEDGKIVDDKHRFQRI